MSDALAIASDYLARGWNPVPIPHRKKKPPDKGWPSRVITEATLPKHFNGAPQNIGVQLGPKSKGLTDIDLDCPEAIELARYFLPETDSIFGRNSKPRSHWLYYVDDAPHKANIKLSDVTPEGRRGDCIVELRMGGGPKGAQTVFPGSVHETGEAIEWVKDGEQARSNCVELETAIRKIAAATILIRRFPAKGSRHDASLALGGFLARAGWGMDDIRYFVEIVTRFGGSTDSATRAQDAVDAAESHARGENVYGLPGLAEFFGEVWVKQVAKILGYTGDRTEAPLSGNGGSDIVIVNKKDHCARARKLRDARRPNLAHYRDDFMDFCDGAYRIFGDGVISHETYDFLDKAKVLLASQKTAPFLPDRKTVGETLAALKSEVHLSPDLDAPFWRNGRTDLPPSSLMAFPNGLLDLRDNSFHDPDPNFFTTSALGFDYVADAKQPTEWLKFLDAIFAGEDKDEQISSLQEMFGYLVTTDMSQEKAFMLLGPKRSGKGTMLSMARRLLAKNSVAGPSLKSLGTTFGLAPLIGKQLAIIDDLRVGAAKEQDLLVENVLKITGRGLFTIDRKFKTAWDGVLPTKLVFVSNVMPKLGDDSSALAGRFIIFNTRVSFYGKEEPRLFQDKLEPEVAGVFHWALEGLQRLLKRGHFAETATSEEARERMGALGSPARAFIVECCTLDPSAHEPKKALYDAYVIHAQENNFFPGTPEKFCEAMYAAGGGLLRPGKPVGADGKQVPSIMGLKLVDSM